MSKCTCASPCGDTEQMVSVPVELAEPAVDAFASIGMHDQLERLNELLEQSDAQHQGEPVKTPARDESLGTAERDEYANGYRHGWNAYNDEIAKLGPLYTHAAAAGEVERLRLRINQLETEVSTAGFNRERASGAYSAVLAQNETLRAQLAERDALLREAASDIRGWRQLAPKHEPSLALLARIDAALSASAEPEVQS